MKRHDRVAASPLAWTGILTVAVGLMDCGARSGLFANRASEPSIDGGSDATLDADVDAGGDVDAADLDGSIDGIVLACGPVTCKGCCTEMGECVLLNNLDYCGWAGERCEKCDQDAGFNKCKSVCFRDSWPNPDPGCESCTGCCWGSYCAMGTQNGACGLRGQHCSKCDPQKGETCVLALDGGGVCSGAVPCGPNTCVGCCVGDICAVGTQSYACGTGGTKCEDCGFLGMICKAGHCGK